MPNPQAVVFKLIISLLILLMSCTESTESEKLKQYLNSINAAEVSLPGTGPSPLPGISPVPVGSGAPAQTISGTPRTVKDGFCGDGVINGPTEDCDQNAIQNTSCRDYGGIAGKVACQANCLYDISDCITPAVDRHIGGIADNCKCNCNASPCRGGCRSSALVGQVICHFICDNDCICQCEGRLESHVEDCELTCVCSVDLSGNPDCACSLDECEILATISPNIATIVTTAIREF